MDPPALNLKAIQRRSKIHALSSTTISPPTTDDESEAAETGPSFNSSALRVRSKKNLKE